MNDKKPVATPLGVICLFASLTEVFLTVAVTQVTGCTQIALVCFGILFPIAIATAFFVVLWLKPQVFYPPKEFGEMTDPLTYAAAMQGLPVPKGAGSSHWKNEGDDRLITPDDVKDKMGGINGMHKEKLQQAYEEAYLHLLIRGIVTLRQLTVLVQAEQIVGVLRKLYIDELKREPDSSLDPVAVATWGVFFLQNGINPHSLQIVQLQIRQSPEYKTKNV